MRAGTLLLLASVVGCSLASEGTGGVAEELSDSASSSADSGAVVDDSSAPDSATPPIDSDTPPLDSAAPAPDTASPPDTTPPPDAAPPCVESACGANPTGAKRIGLVDRTVACPPGFVTTDIQEVRDGDACSCTCATTLPPTCQGVGSIPTWYSSSTSSCATAGLSVSSAGNGACSNLGGSGSLSSYFRATPLPATGGTCVTSVLGDKLSASRPRRMCEAVTCGAAICAAPFLECIESASCGGAFPNPRVVGTDVNVDCPSCACTVAGTCSGSITFYDNGSCGGGTVTVLANDKCVTVPSSGPATVSSFRYTAGLTTTACTPGYAKSKGTPVVTGKRSLCCR